MGGKPKQLGQRKPHQNQKEKKKSGKGGGRKKGPSASMSPYLQMLSDPCGASFTRAPYGGTDSGYMVRTVDQLSLGNLAAPTAVKLDFVVSYVPNLTYNTTIGNPVVYAVNTVGSSSNALQGFKPSNFVATSTAVSKYRPVAACAKFITTGAFGDRSGEVGIGLTNCGHIAKSATNVTASQIMPSSLKRGGNGTDPFEIKWLPANADAQWIDLTTSQTTVNQFPSGAGIFIVGNNIDGSAGFVNGYIELIIIWEWLPAVANGLSTAPVAPPPFTLTQALSVIKDIGEFATGGHFRSGMSVLSGGYKAIFGNKPAMPRLLQM